MKPPTKWTVSDISKSEITEINGREFEFQDIHGSFHHFFVISTKDRVVFGGCTNNGFLESGYIIREDHESLDATLAELISDLETYYNDGPQYVSRIVCNERM